MSWTHNFTPRLFNTFQVGLNRNATTGTPYFETLGTNVAGNLGIAGTWPDPSNYGPPSLSFANGLTGLTDGSPVAQRGANHVAAKLACSGGAANTTLRSAGSSDGWTRIISPIPAAAALSASPAPRLRSRSPTQWNRPLGVNGTGYSFADFLLGLPQTDSVTWGDTRYYRQLNYSAYVNDDYRFLSNLSLSLGVRYEYTSPTDEKYGQAGESGFRGRIHRHPRGGDGYYANHMHVPASWHPLHSAVCRGRFRMRW